MKNPLHFLRAVAGILKLIRDPGQLNSVLAILESLGASPALMKEIVQGLERHPRAARALREMPRLSKIDLEALHRLPEGTFGRVFAEHMSSNNLDANAFVGWKASTPYEYVNAHLAETHDVWHVLTGFGTDTNGELGLQAFYMSQYPNRFAVMYMAIAFLNVLFFSFEERVARMRMISRGWLLGSRARNLFGVRWSDYWSTPISELRRQFNIDVESADAVLPAAPGDERSLPEMLIHPVAHAA